MDSNIVRVYITLVAYRRCLLFHELTHMPRKESDLAACSDVTCVYCAQTFSLFYYSRFNPESLQSTYTRLYTRVYVHKVMCNWYRELGSDEWLHQLRSKYEIA